MTHLSKRWWDSGHKIDTANRLPEDAVVLMDLLSLQYGTQLVSSRFRFVFILMTPTCAESREYHLANTPCGCFIWFVDTPNAGWIAV